MTFRIQTLPYSRRRFLSAAIAAPAMLTRLKAAQALADIGVASPNGHVEFSLLLGQAQLRFQVKLNHEVAIEPSSFAMMLDGEDLSKNTTVVKITRYHRSERYRTRGVHSLALDACNGLTIALEHVPSHTNYNLELRVFNDGLAFRHLIPGAGKRVPDEATTFKIPAGSTVWFHDFEGHYEGIHQKKEIDTSKEGEWAAPPL